MPGWNKWGSAHAGCPPRMVEERPDATGALLACLVGSEAGRAALEAMTRSHVLGADGRVAASDLLEWGAAALAGASSKPEPEQRTMNTRDERAIGARLEGVTLADLSEALDADDPRALNRAAADAGLYWVGVKHRAADKESRRTLLRLEIRREKMEAGTKKTEAEELAKEDARYLDYCADVAVLEQERDTAEVIYNALRQRAYIIANEPAALTR